MQLILDRYKPIETIGTGGFGNVIVAWDVRIQRKVAIKSILLSVEQRKGASLSLKGDPSTRVTKPYGDNSPDGPADEFDEHWLTDIPGLDEARTAAMLQDPSIVGVFDFEIQGNTAYLIMEYVEGITLTQLMEEHDDCMSLDIITAVLDNVAHALSVAHRNGVLHLDIKPDNILITPEGAIKVTDFGLATLADSQGYGTAGGGTIGYMPLEQMRQESLDATCDQWALASVIYEMLAGANPFFAPDLDAAEEVVQEAELVLPSLCWDGMDSRVDDVMFTALDPDPDNRFASVTDFQEAMDSFLGNAERGSAQLASMVVASCGGALAKAGGSPDDEGEYDEDEYEDDEHVGLLARGLALLHLGDNLDGDEDDDEWEEREPRIPLSERLSPVFFKRTSHIISCLATMLMCFVACINLPLIAGFSVSGVTNIYMWGIIAICGILGAWKEHLGFLISFVMLALSLLLNQAYLAGAVLLVVAGAWWFIIGRHGAAFSNCAMSFPLFGAINFAPMAPLLTGYCLSLFDAFFTTLLGCIVALVFGSFGSTTVLGWNIFMNWNIAHVSSSVQANILTMVGLPETWCVLASWLLCAVVVSLCGVRGIRWLKVFGAVAGCVLLLVGEGAAMFFATKGATFIPEVWVLLPTIVAGIIMIIVVVQQNRYYEAQDNLR